MSGGQHEPISIGGLRNLVEIGRGGFGTVFRAVEDDLDRTVAVKVLAGRLDQRARERFDRERRAMGALSGHPNIVTIHRTGFTDDDRPYLVMEYLAKGSVDERPGALAWGTVASIGVQLAGAVETAHRRGVLHRDIKPANILLTEHDQPKLADFGIARLHGGPETTSAVITASVAHAPPEVIAGRRPDERCDIYSLGSSLYEMLAGHAPFSRPTDESLVPLLARIARDPVPDLRQQSIPDAICAVLEMAMAKDPDARPQTAAAFGDALRTAQIQSGMAATTMTIFGDDPAVDAGATSDLRTVLPDAAPTPPAQPTPPASSPAPPPTTGPAATPAAESAGPEPSQAIAGPSDLTGSVEQSVGDNRHMRIILGTAAALVIGLVGFFAWTISRDDDPQIVALAGTTPAVETTTPGSGEIPAEDPTPETPTSAPETPTAAPESPTPTPDTVKPDAAPPFDGLLSDEFDLSQIPDYDSYESITHSNGAFTFDVPTAWSDRNEALLGIDPSIAVSPDLAGAFGADAWTEPGLAIAAYEASAWGNDLATFAETLAQFDIANCSDVDPPEPIAEGPYTGTYQLLGSCASSTAVVLHFAFTHEDDPDHFYQLSIQAVDFVDISATARIVDSLVIDTDLVCGCP